MTPISAPGMEELALHVVREGDEFHVWLDAEPGAPETGVCIAAGGTVRDALGKAHQVLTAAASAAMVAR